MALKFIRKEKTGNIYNPGEDKIVKLFHEEVSEDEIESEYRALKLANQIDYLSPKAYEMITIGDNVGIVIEDIEIL